MPGENPFSTRFVRPGAIPYRFSPERDLTRLLDRFQQIGRTGQIVGPHGGGKSTLLADLVRLWEQNGERVTVFELHDGQRRLPVHLVGLLRDTPTTLIAVDGYEQLNWCARRALRRFCRRRQIGLNVTSHRSMGIPDLARCAPSLALLEQLVRGLLPDGSPQIDCESVRRAFHRHAGNVREVLFELYDLYEAGATDRATTAEENITDSSLEKSPGPTRPTP